MRTLPTDAHVAFAYDETNAVEILHYVGKRLKYSNKCCCARCVDWTDQIFASLNLAEIDLSLRFVDAPLSFQLKALFEDWPISKINEQLCQSV